MYKPRYQKRGIRGKQARPTWGLEVEKKLLEMGMTKTDFAAWANLSYQYVVSVISGSRINPGMQEKILAKISELEAQQGQPPGLQPVIAGQVASGIEKQAV